MSDQENIIKVSHKGEVRRVRTEHRLNYADLEALVYKLFPYVTGTTVRLTYRDEDGDHVTFTNDEELNDAYLLSPRLFVRVRTLSSPKTALRRFVKVTSKSRVPAVTGPTAAAAEPQKVTVVQAEVAVPMPPAFQTAFSQLYQEGWTDAADTREVLLMAGGRLQAAQETLRQAAQEEQPKAREHGAVPEGVAPFAMSAAFSASVCKLVGVYGEARRAEVVDSLICHGGNEPNTCLSLMNESVCDPAGMRAQLERALAESRAEAMCVRQARVLAAQTALRTEREAAQEKAKRAAAKAEAKRREEAAAAARRREEARRLLEEKRRQEAEAQRRAATEAQQKREAALAEQKRIQAETQRQLEEARATRKQLEAQVREQKSKQLLLSIMASCRFANETAAADYQSKLVLLREMGFADYNRCHAALQRHNADLEKTVEFLTKRA
jgi:PB1 domain